MISGMICFLLRIYMLVIIADFLCDFFPQFKTSSWRQGIRKYANYLTKPVRRVAPRGLGFDATHLFSFLFLMLMIFLW